MAKWRAEGLYNANRDDDGVVAVGAVLQAVRTTGAGLRRRQRRLQTKCSRQLYVQARSAGGSVAMQWLQVLQW